MSWLDERNALRNESEEDRALRSELQSMMGLPERPTFFDIQATPEQVALADELQREAERRRRTQRQKPSWMLLAAGLPVLLALSGLTGWGLHQKHRADTLAQNIEAKERENQSLLAASEALKQQVEQQEAAMIQVRTPGNAGPTSPKNPKAAPRALELVLPAAGQTMEPLPTRVVKNQ